MIITRMLDKIIRRSDVVDKESLCIQSGQRVCAEKRNKIRFFLTQTGTGVEFAAHGPLPCRFRQHAGLCMLSGRRRTETFPTTRGGSRRRSSHRSRCHPLSPPSSSELSTAFTGRASTDASVDAPHAVLPHICLFLRHIDPRDPGS